MEKVDLFSYNIPVEWHIDYLIKVKLEIIFYIEDGEKYFVNGKFYRKNWQNCNQTKIMKWYCNYGGICL